jgi:hypothetical protein
MKRLDRLESDGSSALFWCSKVLARHLPTLVARSSPTGVWRDPVANVLVRVEPCLARIIEDLIGRKLPRCSTSLGSHPA